MVEIKEKAIKEVFLWEWAIPAIAASGKSKKILESLACLFLG